MHFLYPNKIVCKRSPLSLVSKLFLLFVLNSCSTFVDCSSVAGCIMMRPMHVALLSVLKKFDNELSYIATTGEDGITDFSDLKILISSGAQLPGGILFLLYLIYS